MKRQLILIGDRVLVKADDAKEITSSGLYLPQGAVEKEKVHSGKVVNVGPGLLVSDPQDIASEVWKESKDSGARYIPLQARLGDHAIFLRSAAVEIEFENTKYVIVPHSAILALVRYDVKPEEI